MLSTVHIVVLGLLDVIGLCANSLFLYTIKQRPAPLNAIDVLQACRTVLVVVALFVCIWVEVVTCFPPLAHTCMGSQVIADNLLFHSTCWSFLSVAYVRRKVCECRGRASVLVTPKYALKTMVLCLTPIGMFVAAGSAMISNFTVVDKTNTNNNTADATPATTIMSSSSKITYDLCHLALVNTTPLFISCVLYYRILMMVTETARNMDRNMANRKRSPTRIIKISVIILLVVTMTTWCIFIVVKFVSVFTEFDAVVFIYLKLVVLTSYPFAEGLLQAPTARNRTIINAVQARSTRATVPPYSPSLSSITGSFGDNGTSLVSQLPSMIEDKTTRKQSQPSKDTTSNTPAMTRRRKRSSVRYSRPSVFAKHAASIGLEWREQPPFTEQMRARRESEERLRSALKSIDDNNEEEGAGYKYTRRLSTCLRLTSLEDGIEHHYKRTPQRRKRSVRHLHKQAIAEEYKGLPYAKPGSAGSDVFSSSEVNNLSPSMRRWKKLLTTARTARQFSKVVPRRSNSKDASSSNNECSIRDKNTVTYKHNEPPGTAGKQETKLSITSLTQSEMYNLFAVQRKSVDITKPEDTIQQSSQKRRTKSVASSVFSDTDNTHKKERNNSVSFVSNFVLDSKPTCSTARSFSCDAKIYVNCDQERRFSERGKMKKHHSENRYSRHSRERKTMWHLRKDTTREECIEKLLEMKDYF